jgi:hypothetical protein
LQQAAVPNEPQVEPQDTTRMGENSTSGTKPGDWSVVSIYHPFYGKEDLEDPWFSLVFPAFPALPGLHHWSCPNHPKNAGGRVPIAQAAQVPRLGGALVFRDHDMWLHVATVSLLQEAFLQQRYECPRLMEAKRIIFWMAAACT